MANTHVCTMFYMRVCERIDSGRFACAESVEQDQILRHPTVTPLEYNLIAQCIAN